MDTPHPIDRLDCNLIRERLRQRDCRGEAHAQWEGLATEPVRRAAVLLALFRPEATAARAPGWHLLFIRRAVHLHDRHSGEVGFPGGRWEPGDPTSAATALREAQEEIGLDPGQVRLLGELRPLQTVSRFLVTPVVGYIPWPQPLQPAPREVSRIFSIPLAWLCQPERHRVQPYASTQHPQIRDLIFFDEYDGERLWGVSARIALDLLSCLTQD